MNLSFLSVFYQFSPALLNWVHFIYSISFSNLRFGFKNSENYFRIRQQQGTLNLKEGDKVYTKFFLQGG